MSETSYYTPGVCNINEAEVAYRMKAFYLGLGIGLPLIVALAVFKAAPILGILVFLPAWIGAIGYFQAKYKFCVGYAASGVYNNSAEYAETQAIVDAASKKLDGKRARKIHTMSLLTAAVVTAATCGLLTVIS